MSVKSGIYWLVLQFLCNVINGFDLPVVGAVNYRKTLYL